MNLAGNTKRMHGLESFFGYSGTSGFVGTPSDSYGNLTTNLGTYGGDWTGTWPAGTGDTQYNFWSPLIVDYTNTSWAATTKTFPNTWQEVLNFAVTYGEVLQQAAFDVFLLDPNLLRQAKDSLKSVQTLEVTQSSDLVKLGHKTMQYNGIELAMEYGCPSGVGYGLAFSHLELWSMQDQLLKMERDTDITTSADLLALDWWGNLFAESPAFFCKLAAIS